MGGAGVTGLSNHLDVSKASVHSHLATLRRNEFVVKEGGSYRLSLRFLNYGEVRKRNVEFYDIIVKELDALARETGDIAHFMIEEHGLGVYIYKSSGSSAVQTSSYPGNRKHLHCTALGKAILAHLPRERVREIIDRRGFPRHTENTITERAALFEELDDIRKQGYGLDREEVLKGLQCVAAPILKTNGDLLGSISISVPVGRTDEKRFKEELPEKVTNTANVIEVQIGAAQFPSDHEE